MEMIKQYEKAQNDASTKAQYIVGVLEIAIRNGETADLVRGALGSFNYRKLEEAIAARKEEDRIFNEIMDSELATRKT